MALRPFELQPLGHIPVAQRGVAAHYHHLQAK
jgi:hypothetical protein